MSTDFSAESLVYHEAWPPGKIKIGLSKPCLTQKDLSLAYTPGVGAPCMEIAKDRNNVWKYTNRSNTVAVISDGTAVLGLGNIGAEAGLPVMEGKAVLFKKFADIDAFPLCLRFNQTDKAAYVQDFITAVSSMEPSLGGINLEDIAAPMCFELQEKLDKALNIPVFHDDQNGTAVIIIAGILNSLKIVNKNIKNIKVVINGAGAAGISCARLFLKYGLTKEQLFMCDRKGLITETRADINDYKKVYAQPSKEMELKDAIRGADVFIGVSAAKLVSQDMVKSMAKDAIIFAVANPVPEIMPEEAIEAGAVVVGSGRSDYPNQVNNSLGFPGLFRAALDTRSTTINQEMEIAAVEAIASLVNEEPDGFILETLQKAYPTNTQKFILNAKYVIPKQFDLRVVPRVAKMVAKAAMESGVAQLKIADFDAYEKEVINRILLNWK